MPRAKSRRSALLHARAAPLALAVGLAREVKVRLTRARGIAPRLAVHHANVAASVPSRTRLPFTTIGSAIVGVGAGVDDAKVRADSARFDTTTREASPTIGAPVGIEVIEALIARDA